jgi:hypothetical protein
VGTQLSMLVAACVYTAVLAVVTYFTRPTRRRFLGALAGGLAVAVVGIGIEVACQSLWFWHYASTDERTGPLAMYPVIVLMWTIYSHVGWRIMRRFSWRGWAMFLAAVTVLGTFRDYRIADQALGIIALAPGYATVVVDAVCWAGLTALAQAVMRLIAGPAASDTLAKWPWEHPET